MFKLASVALTLSLAAAIDIEKHGGGGKGPKQPFDGCVFEDEEDAETLFNEILTARDDPDRELPADAITFKELKMNWKDIGGGSKKGVKKFFE